MILVLDEHPLASVTVTLIGPPAKLSAKFPVSPLLQTKVSVPVPPLASAKTSSPNDNNLDFDPKAGLIIIDGSSPEKMKGQSVKIINRPSDTLAPRSNFYKDRLDACQVITANLVRYIVNPKTGKMIFYYFDSRECRWVESIQQITPKGLDIGKLTGNPRVFAWVQDPIMSKLI